MKMILKVSGKTIQFFCHDALATQAKWLGGLLRDILKEQGLGFLKDGATIGLGWSVLKFVQIDDHYLLCEPDFSSNPFSRFRKDLTCTLQVQMEQNELLKLFEIEEGVPTRFDQKMIIAKGCLNEREIYLERIAVDDPADSGWFIGYKEQPATAMENEALYVYQLLELRPTVLKALIFPIGYLVVFDGYEIVSIVNEQNETP